ncbi:Hypothetical predicted protein [Olea europaea subsp. europaea]|uniref:Uncharacterized protein n=1 Tax=Olea europaea subsp. europaea TaxID=158383 RepID=A0A8S0UJJ0_OLEEU|nr:Hypothetical predicted protein [Olea europaea subsp. europaea]
MVVAPIPTGDDDSGRVRPHGHVPSPGADPATICHGTSLNIMYEPCKIFYAYTHPINYYHSGGPSTPLYQDNYPKGYVDNIHYPSGQVTLRLWDFDGWTGPESF